jgi:hypothetical protein
MQFSIFSVPFKCTRDMFIQDKVLWTIYIFWAQFWRLLLISLGVVTLLVSYVLFTGADYSSFIGDGYSWVENLSIITLISLIVLGLVLYGLIIYIQYYVYFEKNFQSFSKKFFNNYKPKFFSWGFWKPFLIIVAITFIVDSVFTWIFPSNITNGFNFIFGLFFQHICIHGETWGFSLASKR